MLALLIARKNAVTASWVGDDGKSYSETAASVQQMWSYNRSSAPLYKWVSVRDTSTGKIVGKFKASDWKPV